MMYKDAKAAWDQAKEREAAAQTDYDKTNAAHTAAIRARWDEKKSGNLNPDRAELDEIENRLIEQNNALTVAKIESALYRDNAKAALLAELKSAALEILEKYNGKPYGEKTSRKISDEMKAKTGFYMSLYQQYSSSEIHFYYGSPCGPFGSDNLEIGYYKGTEGNRPILEENKIRLDSFDALRPTHGEKTTEDPAARTAEIFVAYKEAEAAQAAWEAARNKYNHLIPKTTCRRMDNDGKPYGILKY